MEDYEGWESIAEHSLGITSFFRSEYFAGESDCASSHKIVASNSNGIDRSMTHEIFDHFYG